MVNYELEPEKYNSGPYTFVATDRGCACPKAYHPFGILGAAKKSAAKVIAEWVKVGWEVHTSSIRSGALTLPWCEHQWDGDMDDIPHFYVAEQRCGCIAGVQPFLPGSKAGVAKVLAVWVESGYYIQVSAADDIRLEIQCPHTEPEPTQQYLPGIASAEVRE